MSELVEKLARPSLMQNITPDAKHHAKIIRKYKALRRRNTIFLWLMGIVCLPLATALSGSIAYEKATTLLAHETIYVSEEQETQDRLDTLTAEHMAALEHEFRARQYAQARGKAIETLEGELAKEKEALRREEINL